jgi:SAM-dependent methyltransferase
MRVLVLAAGLVGLASGCGWLKRLAYEGFFRDRWQRPETVMRLLDLRPGSRVADLGAGGGYFTFRLAEAVAPGGIVYAVDVDPDMVDYVRARATSEGYRQVVPVLAATDDPRLPEAVDLVFTCNTYHHLPDPPAYFARLRQRLRPGGRVAVVEYRGSHGILPRLFGHATDDEVIERDLATAGYRLLHEHDVLPRQHFLVFTVAADG